MLTALIAWLMTRFEFFAVGFFFFFVRVFLAFLSSLSLLVGLFSLLQIEASVACWQRLRVHGHEAASSNHAANICFEFDSLKLLPWWTCALKRSVSHLVVLLDHSSMGKFNVFESGWGDRKRSCTYLFTEEQSKFIYGATKLYIKSSYPQSWTRQITDENVPQQ